MTVHDRHDLGLRPEDLAVDEALEIGRAALRIDRVAVEVEFHDVGRRNQPRRHAARQQKALRVLVVAGADMAEPVDHALVEENAVGGDDILDQRRVCIRHFIPPQPNFLRS